MKNLKFIFITAVFGMFVFAAACTPADSDTSATENMDEMDHEEMEGMEHDDEHTDDHMRIPNEGGATVKILSPSEGDAFENGAEFEIEVEVENFALGEEGNHWHIYIDGSSLGMIVGGDTNHVVRGIEPGMHEVAVYIANGAHEEYEDGDSVMITINE